MHLEKELLIPKKYFAKKTTQKITIDGMASEDDWSSTPFSEDFIDIEGGKVPYQKTNFKMLWDDDFLYVYARLKENHVWGDIYERDQVIYHNNDFEVFIDPDGDTYNYAELEINALGTEWDLLLDKPYRLGGKANSNWNLKKLQSSVHVEGTVNKFDDLDNGWNVEIALPIDELVSLKKSGRYLSVLGEVWRINFSRVQWEFEINNGKYERKKKEGELLPENNWVWSNQGEINMHIPENWGYLIFVDPNETHPDTELIFSGIELEQTAYAIFRKVMFGELRHLKDLNLKDKIEFKTFKINNLKIISNFRTTEKGFEIQVQNREDMKNLYTIKQNGILSKTVVK